MAPENTYSLHKTFDWNHGNGDSDQHIFETYLGYAQEYWNSLVDLNSEEIETGEREYVANKMAGQYGIIYRVGTRKP